MTSPAIKPTTKDDVPELQIVLDQTELFPSELLPDMLNAAIENETEAIWLTCQLDGSAVGLCNAVPEEMSQGTWNMLALAIRPDLQGRKLGKALVEAAEQLLRSKGQRLMIVETSATDDFAPARRFYALNGYEEEARIRDFWSAGDDKVIFRKVL